MGGGRAGGLVLAAHRTSREEYAWALPSWSLYNLWSISRGEWANTTQGVIRYNAEKYKTQGPERRGHLPREDDA